MKLTPEQLAALIKSALEPVFDELDSLAERVAEIKLAAIPGSLPDKKIEQKFAEHVERVQLLTNEADAAILEVAEKVNAKPDSSFIEQTVKRLFDEDVQDIADKLSEKCQSLSHEIVRMSVKHLEDINAAKSQIESVDEASKNLVAQTIKRIVEPVEAHQEGTRFFAGQRVVKDGGTYQALFDTTSTPSKSGSWFLTSNGIKSIIENETGLEITSTDGQSATVKHGGKGEKGKTGDGLNFRGLYADNTDYQKNDLVVLNGSVWIAKDETKSAPPCSDWSVFCKRGARGAKGETPKIDFDSIRDLCEDVLIKQVKPIIEKQVDASVSSSLRFRGIWKSGEQYQTGDVVRHTRALYVATMSNSNAAPKTVAGGEPWALMLQNTSSSSTTGGGGGEPVPAGIFENCSMRLSQSDTQTFSDATIDKINMFDEETRSSDYCTANATDFQLEINEAGFYEITIALNGTFPANEELQVYIFVDGVSYSSNPISMQGDGNGRPVELYWSSLVEIPAGTVLDVRGTNGDNGSFALQFIRTRFAAEYKGAPS